VGGLGRALPAQSAVSPRSTGSESPRPGHRNQNGHNYRNARFSGHDGHRIKRGSAVLEATGVRAEEKFLKLTGGHIQARVSDMEMIDEVHWGDVYRRNGALITTEMGHKTTGKWRIQKDQLCLDRRKEMGSGFYEVWPSGKNVQLKNGDSSVPFLEGVLKKPIDRE
jgi:hypothetical protein